MIAESKYRSNNKNYLEELRSGHRLADNPEFLIIQNA
jgi:hypothetical protein